MFVFIFHRNHIRPSVSTTLLFRSFYTNFRLDHSTQATEYDTDVSLEFDEKEIYEDFQSVLLIDFFLIYTKIVLK